MPRKLVYEGGAIDQTYIYDEKGELVGTKEGDHSKDPLLMSGSVPLKNIEGVEPPMDRYSIPNKLREMGKQEVINAAVGGGWIPGGRGIGALLGKLVGSVGLGTAVNKLLNPDKSVEDAAAETIPKSLVAGLTSGALTHGISMHPKVMGGSRFGRIWGAIDPTGIRFPYKQETVMVEPPLAQVPKNTIITIDPPEMSIPGLPPGWKAVPKVAPVAKDYLPGQMLPRAKVPVERDIQVPGLKKFLAGVAANNAIIDIPQFLADLATAKTEK